MQLFRVSHRNYSKLQDNYHFNIGKISLKHRKTFLNTESNLLDIENMNNLNKLDSIEIKDDLLYIHCKSVFIPIFNWNNLLEYVLNLDCKIWSKFIYNIYSREHDTLNIDDVIDSHVNMKI